MNSKAPAAYTNNANDTKNATDTNEILADVNGKCSRYLVARNDHNTIRAVANKALDR
ncbi:hypothetical protein [Streptomyces sp. NPDC003077]|uniref:hypothetical protein n=1 Tax=Streptomyces sp. NPDC003077 TaxID=3154443 RepID=UPI0033BAE4E0